MIHESKIGFPDTTYNLEIPESIKNFVVRIIESQGIPLNPNHNNHISTAVNRDESQLVNGFYMKYPNCGPETTIGQLIQLIACDETLIIKRGKCLTNLDEINQRPKDAMTKKQKARLEIKIDPLRRRLVTLTATSAIIAESEKILANKIFGEENFKSKLDELKSTFFWHRHNRAEIASITSRKMERDNLLDNYINSLHLPDLTQSQ